MDTRTKRFAPNSDGDVGDGPRDERVVSHRLDRIRLDESDVLVRRRVEDDGGAVLLEDLSHLGGVAGVGENRGSGMKLTLVHELPLDLEEPGLRVVHQHEPRRAYSSDLPTELRSDRASGSGDEHDLAGEVARDRLEIRVNGLATEKVLDLDGPDLASEVEVARNQVVQARQRLHGDALGARDLDDPLTCFTRRRRNGDQELVGPTLAEDLPELAGGPDHPNPVQAKVLLARIVVDEPYRRIAQ